MGTATSNRGADRLAIAMDQAFGGTFGTRYEIGRFFRKVVKDIPLVNLRELVSGDIPSGRVETVTVSVPLTQLRQITVAGETADLMTDVDFGGTADRQFGLLGGETLPKLQPEGGEGGADEIAWASGSVTPIAFKVSVPDIDTTQDVTVTLRAVMASTNDNPTFSLDSYFGEGDTKVEDASGTVDDTTENLAVTIAAADVPSGARTLGVEITPAAHGTDILTLYEVRVSYTSTRGAGAGGLLDKGTTPILEAANGDTDGQWRVHWASSGVDPVGFQIGLEDIDTDEDLLICIRAKMGGSSDTPVIDADSYFNEGDGKVSDASSALGATVAEDKIVIASADIPAAARTLTVELTPAAHGSDALYLYEMHVEYTRKFPVDA